MSSLGNDDTSNLQHHQLNTKKSHRLDQIVGLEFIPDHKRRIWLKPSSLTFSPPAEAGV